MEIIRPYPSYPTNFYTQEEVDSKDQAILNQLTITSGDIVDQIPSLAGYATESWVDSNYVTLTQHTVTSGDIIAYVDQEISTVSGGGGGVTYEDLTTTSGDIINYVDQEIIDNLADSTLIVGSGNFSGHTGYEITHSLGYDNHSVSIVPAGINSYDSDEIAKIGTVYVELGTETDTVYNTGGSDSDGLPFTWIITASGQVNIVNGGGGTASSLDCVVCSDGDLIIDNNLIAASGIFSEGIQVGSGTIHVLPTKIIFPDNTEISTASNVVTCTGTEYMVNTTYLYSDSNQVELFDLPAGHELVEASVTVVSGFNGYYGEDASYLNMTLAELIDESTNSYTMSDDYIYLNSLDYPLENGRWITHVSFKSEDSNDLYFKLYNHVTGSIAVGSDITFSGGNSFVNHAGSSSVVWYTCDPIQVPDDGADWLIGIWFTGGELTNTTLYNSGWNINQTYQSNVFSEPTEGAIYDSVYTTTDRACPMSVRYGPAFCVGDVGDTDSILEQFDASVQGTISGIRWGSDLAIRPTSRSVRLFYLNDDTSTSGSMDIYFKYKERCGEWFNITAGTNAWVEQDGLDFDISFVPDCSLFSCTISGELLHSDTFPRRLFVLPAGHVLDKIDIEVTESFGGGYSDTVGFGYDSSYYNRNFNANSTVLNTVHKIDNGSTITAWTMYAEEAGNVKLKVAEQDPVTSNTFNLVDVDTYRYHGGTGFETFVLDTPYTISGTGDWFIACVSDNIMDYSAIYVYNSGWLKSGDLTGVQTGFNTSYDNIPNIKLHLNNSYSIGDDVDYYKFSAPFNMASTSGIITISGGGPFLEAKPIYLHQSFSEPDTQGQAFATITYHKVNRDEMVGSGVVWQGTGGATINHDLNTLDHITIITPIDVSAGGWWVTKGVDQDLAYSDTLSGTGTFDWIVKRI